MYAFAAACASAGACGPARPPSGISGGVAEIPAAAPAIVASDGWTLALPEEPAAYVLESSAVIVARADTMVKVDTADVRAAVSVVPRGAALDVTISSFAVRIGAATVSLPQPARALGRFDRNGAIAFQGAALDDCASPTAAAVDFTRDLWVRPPPRVRVGDVWTDSASRPLCRDGVPLRSTIERDYRVLAADSAAQLLTIVRRTRVALAGSGALRGDTVRINGRGTGEATLKISTRSGWVVSGTGNSQLRFEATGRNRVQSVEQQLHFTFMSTTHR